MLFSFLCGLLLPTLESPVKASPLGKPFWPPWRTRTLLEASPYPSGPVAPWQFSMCLCGYLSTTVSPRDTASASVPHGSLGASAGSPAQSLRTCLLNKQMNTCVQEERPWPRQPHTVLKRSLTNTRVRIGISAEHAMTPNNQNCDFFHNVFCNILRRTGTSALIVSKSKYKNHIKYRTRVEAVSFYWDTQLWWLHFSRTSSVTLH